MHFAHFSALLLLTSTVAATPRQHWKGKWEHFHHHSSFGSLEDASAGFTVPSGTGTAPVIPQGTVLVAPPKAVVSRVPSVSSTEFSGDDTNKEAAKPDVNPGLPSSSAPPEAVSSSPAAPVSKSAPTTPASSSSSSSGGVSYSATFTKYGLNDGTGSPNCNAATVSCGFYNTPGYNAAVSQNLFGAASGKTHTCGTCANVNFDLCKDDGAANALFGNSGIGMAFGKATQVSCDLWTGSQSYTTGTMPSMPTEMS
ncbi:MAG: hypothetical protein Q9175_000538 [Cornicularia normoerica]